MNPAWQEIGLARPVECTACGERTGTIALLVFVDHSNGLARFAVIHKDERCIQALS